MSSPRSKGCRKRPAVPRMHTRIKTHRNILSITMATYFQSSWTCSERERKQQTGEKEERGREVK